MAKKRTDLVFVISAGSKYGMGHLMRSAVLAREAGRKGMTCKFLLKGDKAAGTVLERELPGIEVAEWSDSNILTSEAGVFVFDTKEDLDRELSIAAETGAKSVFIDRLSPQNELVDLYILPVAHALVPENMREKTLSGLDYVILSEVFLNSIRDDAFLKNKRDTLLITLGGSDPFNVTERVLDACYGCRELFKEKKVVVVAGPANQRAGAIREKGERYGMEVVVAPDQKSYCDLLLSSFLVIVGFGITVYELAYLGVPALYITHYREDGDGARKLESVGLGRFIGYGPDLFSTDISSAVEAALSEADLAKRKPAIVLDGKGASRIIEKLRACELINHG